MINNKIHHSMKISYVLLIILFSSSLYAQVECELMGTPSNSITTSTNCDEILLSYDEISPLPQVNFKLAFHFKAKSNGQNFTCDPNDPIVNLNWHFYAPNYVNRVVSELNDRMSEGLVINGTHFDMDVRFSLQNGGDCGPGIFIYGPSESISPIADAINIHFLNDPQDPGIRGWTSFGVNNIYVENVMDQALQGSVKWWEHARLINHEFGHTRHLHHTFYCDNPCNGIDIDADDECYGTCKTQPNTGNGCFGSSTLTMGYGPQLYFTKCEYEQLWNYILNNDRPYQSFDICEESATSIEINQDFNSYVIWDEVKVFNQNVRIKTGTTIEVICDVLMGANKRIIVEPGAKLIVNGGRITNLCEDEWRGISVYGGNTDFDVKFTNQAVIENTSGPAVTMLAPEPWPNVSNFGNGILHAEYTTFNNTSRLVELISWSPLPNASYIRNCIQNGGSTSITNWNCQGVEILDNEFKNIENYCLVSETGSFIAENNNFNSIKTDILFNNVSAGIHSEIKYNSFNGQSNGYNARGTTFAQNIILGNEFQCGSIDFINDGQNQFDCQYNTFSASFGVFSSSNGSGITDVGHNEFDGNFAGIVTRGDNLDFNFFENCYSTIAVDNHIAGSVSTVIHNNIGAANNCFSHAGISNSSITDIGGSPSLIYYLEPQDINTDCRDAINASAGVTRLPWGGQLDLPNCGYTSSISTNETNCFPDQSLTIINAINILGTLTTEIDNVQNDQNLTSEQIEIIVSMKQRCYRRVQMFLIESYINSNDYISARNILMSDSSNSDYQVLIFSTYVLENDLVGAQQYLNSITTNQEDMLDFIDIQNINLDRIPLGPFYQPSTSELLKVETIALKTHRYSGYAKALHYIFTNEVILSSMPDIQESETRRGKSLEHENGNGFVYPNPFDNILMMTMDNDCTKDVRIFNINGNIVYQNSTESSELLIKTSNLVPGLYTLVVNCNNELEYSEIFLKVE